MDTDKTTESDVDTSNNEGDGTGEADENISIPKKDYDTLNQTLGSLKRELKDLKKPKEEPKETPKETKPDESVLLKRLENLSFRQEGITHQDDKDLALSTAKKWGMDLDEVLVDEDFKVKLERQQSTRTNALASSNLRGGAGATQAKLTPEYWIAKGAPPSKTDVPDRKTRAKIVRAMMATAETDGKTFYND